jgi:hypothetical protein
MIQKDKEFASRLVSSLVRNDGLWRRYRNKAQAYKWFSTTSEEDKQRYGWRSTNIQGENI